MGYKKSQNPNISLTFSKFSEYMGRISDLYEDKLYSDTSDFWLALCLSGYSTLITSADKDMPSTSPRELVDLGDGVPRYKVKIKIIAGGFGTSQLSPTDYYSKIDPSNPAEMLYSVRQHPWAYTEGMGHIPVFGSYLLIEEMEGSYFIRKIISQSQEEYKATANTSTTNAFNDGPKYETGDPDGIYPGTVSEPEHGVHFVVNGVKYISVPAVNAGNRAKALYDSAQAAGQHDAKKWTPELRTKYPEIAKKEAMGKTKIGWEETETGRNWVATYIYEPHKKGYGATYGPRLGMSQAKFKDPEDESHWSSWFTYTALKPYKKKFSKKGGQHSRGYPARKGYAMREKIESDVSSHIGMEFFCTFKSSEAPIYVGDLLFNWSGYKKVKGTTYEDLGNSKTSGAGAHMRVCASATATSATFHGGNEGQKVGSRTVELENGILKVVKSTKRFIAVYKKVKVVGKA